MPDHYTLLNISPHSPREVVEQSLLAFRERLPAYAPGVDTSDKSLRLAFPEIWNAYQVLLDPDRRKDYDNSIGIAAIGGETTFVQDEDPAGSQEAGIFPRLRYFVKGLIFFLLTATILYAFISLFGAL